MSDPPRSIDQAELDALMQQLGESGKHMAAVGDDRYSIRLQERGGVMWLAIRGVVMQPVPSEFSDRLAQLIDAETIGAAMVDMRECTYLCSSALGVLAMLLHGERSVGGKVVLLGASEKIKRMMDLVGLGEHFISFASEVDAARYLLQHTPAKPPHRP